MIKNYLRLAAASAIAAACPVAFGNLLTNGSFESGSYNWNGNGGEDLGTGSSVITGWTTVNAELAAIENGNVFGLTSEDGNVFLDLTGSHDSSPYGGVQQTITTVAGQSYVLTFWIGVDNANGLYAAPNTIEAGVNGVFNNFTNDSTGASNQWVQATDDFIASSTSTTITLTGVGSGGGEYIGLDNADVEPSSAPEPMALGLLALGAIALAKRRLRR